MISGGDVDERVERTFLSTMAALGRKARDAAAELAHTPSEAKRRALKVAAETVEARAGEIVAANAMDMEFGREKGSIGCDAGPADAG